MKTCRDCDEPICSGSNMMCKAHYNEYMKEYMLRRYYKRREAAIAALGGKCVVCGSQSNLEIDHINPKDKNISLGKAFAGYSQERIDAELSLCQLLCEKHHLEKTRKDLSVKFSQREHWQHGTIAGYRYCKCDDCLTAHKEYCRQYNQANSLKEVEHGKINRGYNRGCRCELCRKAKRESRSGR